MIKWSVGKTLVALGRETSIGWKMGLSRSFSHSCVALNRRERKVQGSACTSFTHIIVVSQQHFCSLWPGKGQMGWHATICVWEPGLLWCGVAHVCWNTLLSSVSRLLIHCYSPQKWTERLFHSCFSALRNVLQCLASSLSMSMSRHL